jgi:hypothetical protein
LDWLRELISAKITSDDKRVQIKAECMAESIYAVPLNIQGTQVAYSHFKSHANNLQTTVWKLDSIRAKNNIISMGICNKHWVFIN